ncbi:MAG: hypothetical protein AVDCRST_MAG85-646, partial [uncultured Solirubrobacteraceae bacterium]
GDPRGDRDGGRRLQRAVRDRRRRRHGAPADPVARVRGADRDGHLPRGDRAHRRHRRRDPGRLRQRARRRRAARRDPGGRRRAVRDVAAATGPGAVDLRAVRRAARGDRCRADHPV